MSGAERGVRAVDVTRFEANSSPRELADQVVIEEPLEIRVAGEALAVTMRTPGHDHELVAGFALAEGLIASRDDLGGIAHCGRPDQEGYGNVIELTPAAGSTFDVDHKVLRRGTLTTSACGVCGRRTISDLLERLQPLDDAVRAARATLIRLTAELRGEQHNFAATGGLHAAGIADVAGSYIVVREDVGRHNAVDKAIGRLLLDARLPARERILVVSGRSSFEIVQKAFVARVPIVVSVSAPSSLAIETAISTGMTLIGFSRAQGFNVYSGPERVSEL